MQRLHLSGLYLFSASVPTDTVLKRKRGVTQAHTNSDIRFATNPLQLVVSDARLRIREPVGSRFVVLDHEKLNSIFNRVCITDVVRLCHTDGVLDCNSLLF